MSAKPKAISPRYSGNLSVKFWNLVNSYTDDPRKMMLYIAGCALQDHERRVLQMLEEMEKKE